MASIPSGVDSCQAHSQAHREETAPPSPTTLKPAHKDPFLANMERLYERQASWQRSARETSSGSSSSFTTSPISPSLAGEPMAQIPEASSSNTKRKNKNAAEDDGAGKTKSRKKVAKACLTCQKSHLTCDDVRPCTRCIKKGVGDQCQEGVRKKAKYLFDGDERAPTQTPASREGSASPPTTFLAPLPPTPQLSLLPPQLDSHRAQKPRVSEDIWLSAPAPLVDNDLATGLVAGNGNEGGLDKYWSGGSNSFGNTALTDQYPYTSAAANMEYEMLDSMFDVFPFTDETNSTNNDNSAGFNGLNTNTDNNTTSNFWPGQNVNPSPAPESYFPQMSSINTDAISDAFAPRPYTPHNLRSTSTNGNTPSSESSLMPPSTAPTRVGTTGDIYRTIVKPYDYTEGYHILMQYLTQNFEQAEILRVVRALATFRPSLIALQMPMTEEDEIFVERSFQRTLIELEKLISYSSTPTAVWRRTGEICYTNPEFGRLVHRTATDLSNQNQNQKTYIYQLFSKLSTINYWENFSVHAFENTEQNFYQPTTVMVNGSAINCSCCFTIRRDVFDLPSVVIGQFLPIPPDA